MSYQEVIDKFRAARRKPDLAVLEGFHAIKHAIRFGAEIQAVVAVDRDQVEDLARLLAPDVWAGLGREISLVDEPTFQRLTDPRPPTGIAAIAERRRTDAEDLLGRSGPGPVVLLENPRQLNNVGAAIRVAAAADAEALVTTGDADPWHPAAIRGAAGLQYALPVSRLSSLDRVLRPILALDPEGRPLDPGKIPAGAVLAFGSERRGLSGALLDRADDRVALPMRPGVSSMNLATSVAAVLYALRLADPRSSELRRDILAAS